LNVLIRTPNGSEYHPIHALAQTIVTEIYGSEYARAASLFDESFWSHAWIAVSGQSIGGVVRTHEDSISDLWVARESRGRWVGQKLLARGESEIAARGHKIFRLRVVSSNTGAVKFYARQGWSVVREFPHERFPVTMLEMIKAALHPDQG
jgi:ribosomal protein S18 acetylase RimI-like enzyme